MLSNSITQVSIERVVHDKFSRYNDVVATEEPMEIRVVVADGTRSKAHSVAVTMRTPGQDFELAAGFLLTEGIISQTSDIKEISRDLTEDTELPLLRMRTPPIDSDRDNIVNVYLGAGSSFDPMLLTRNFFMTSSCGVCGKASLEALRASRSLPIPNNDSRFQPATIRSLHNSLRKAQDIFQETGGLHAAGFFDPDGNLLTLMEDVGRHNAMDKLIGHHLLRKNIPIEDGLIVVSGRASWEIMQKALAAGISTVVAMGAPSSLAIELALEFGLTLIGFAGREDFNIYAGSERISHRQTT